MKENYKKMSSVQLMFALISSVDSAAIKYVDGANPFVVNVGEDSVNIYIKNLSPAQLSNNNPDIWRIQLPVRDDFNAIKASDNLFVLFGYDSEREVFTSWNPYWCKQRLNVGKSVSLYSRLSLQQRVHDSGEIERMDLNNDGDVVCIPKSKIGEFLLSIKSYYPEETVFVPKGSSIQRRLNSEGQAASIFEDFKKGISDPNQFRLYLLGKGMSDKSSKDYMRHVSDFINCGLVDKYKTIFLLYTSLNDYKNALREFLHQPEVAAIDKNAHGYYRTGFNHYLEFLTSGTETPVNVENANREEDVKQVEPEVATQIYPRDEFGKITCLDEKMRKELYPFVEDEEYPDYDEMVNIVNGYYPKSILEKMSYADWIKIFKSETWKKSSAPDNGEQKSSSKFRTKTLRVIRPNGSVVQHKFVADTYEEIIKESYPDLIMELGITHAGVNIVSKEYDERYSGSQRPIGGGFLLMTNSSTEQKYEDLVFINEQLELGYTIELLSLDGTPLKLKEREPRPGHSTIKVTFPNGKEINHNRVFKTLVEVVEYAGPENVEKLNIIVCYKNLILRQPHDTYPVACKPVGDGWYVNTYTNTETKCSQIQLISDALGLGLKTEIIE